jgi:pyruvate,water dikinase
VSDDCRVYTAIEARQDRIAAAIHTHHVSQPAEAEAAAQIITGLLADLTVPPVVVEALRGRWPAALSSSIWLAVRSSATAEDRADASFAGQYETVLGVPARDEAALHEAILACWRSFFSPNALVARAAAGSLHEPDGRHCSR